MKKTTLIAALGLAALAAPAFAQDVAKGEKDFAKCKACHAIVADDGTEIVKGGKVGPNLYGVIGRPVAGVADYKYGDDILAVGAAGAVWDEAMLAAYVADPVAWLKENGRRAWPTQPSTATGTTTRGFFTRWFMSTNHKDIGILYLFTAGLVGLISVIFTVYMRMELMEPGVQYMCMEGARFTPPPRPTARRTAICGT
jgi:cytochrome c